MTSSPEARATESLNLDDEAGGGLFDPSALADLLNEFPLRPARVHHKLNADGWLSVPRLSLTAGAMPTSQVTVTTTEGIVATTPAALAVQQWASGGVSVHLTRLELIRDYAQPFTEGLRVFRQLCGSLTGPTGDPNIELDLLAPGSQAVLTPSPHHRLWVQFRGVAVADVTNAMDKSATPLLGCALSETDALYVPPLTEAGITAEDSTGALCLTWQSPFAVDIADAAALRHSFMGRFLGKDVALTSDRVRGQAKLFRVLQKFASPLVSRREPPTSGN